MPSTLTGKVDLAALPPPLWITEPPTAFVPPRTGIEQRLARLWKIVLPVAQVGAEDDFFDRGGTSLKAMRLKALIEDEIGVDLPVGRIFHTPRLRPLAVEIGDLAAALDIVTTEEWERSGPDQEIRASLVPVIGEIEDLFINLLREKARALARRTVVDFPAVCTVAQIADLRFQVVIEGPIDPMLNRMLRLPVAEALAHESLLVKVTAPGFHLVQDRARLTLPLAQNSEAVLFKLVPFTQGRHLVEIEVFAEADRVAYLTLESEAMLDVN
jgi:hypothetical protein